jgi:lipopolysaccharide heptosyltransferase I
MSAPHRTPLADYPAQRIALIKPSALGDIVHSLPVLTALRQRYPRARITWVVNRGFEGLLRGHPDLDATLAFDRQSSGWLRSALLYTRLLARLRRQAFDLVIDLQGLFRSGMMTAATGAARRVGLTSAREGAARFYTDVVPVADFNAIHAVDRYWLVAEALGAGAGPKTFRVPVADSARAWAEDVLRKLPRPWLVMGVGSRWVTKRWLPEHFAALARRAQERFQGTAILIGTRDEEPWAAKATEGVPGSVCNLTGRTTLPNLAALLERADVVVANDTGPLHLAAALGRPVLAPYTCTRVLLNGPYGAHAHAVATRVWCHGSYIRRCARLECMAELTAERLWPVLEDLLTTWESNRRSA